MLRRFFLVRPRLKYQSQLKRLSAAAGIWVEQRQPEQSQSPTIRLSDDSAIDAALTAFVRQEECLFCRLFASASHLFSFGLSLHSSILIFLPSFHSSLFINRLCNLISHSASHSVPIRTYHHQVGQWLSSVLLVKRPWIRPNNPIEATNTAVLMCSLLYKWFYGITSSYLHVTLHNIHGVNMHLSQKNVARTSLPQMSIACIILWWVHPWTTHWPFENMTIYFLQELFMDALHH